MQEYDLLLMSLVIFVPSLFAFGLLFFPRGYEEAMRWWTLAGTALTLGLSLCAFISFKATTLDNLTGRPADIRTRAQLEYRAAEADRLADRKGGPEQRTDKQNDDWVARRPWIEPFNIDYYLGTDGISMALVVMTTVLSFLAMIASWNITKFVRGYCILFLVLETGMLGVFLSLDFFLFFIFWEVMLLPMYFLIGVWGGPRREYAAIKFFLYTLLGGVFMLIVILAFYFTDIRDFKKDKPPDEQNLSKEAKERWYEPWSAEGTPKEAVHTFDLVLLAHVGREASKIIDSRDDSVLVRARKALAEEKDSNKQQILKEKIDRLTTKWGFFTSEFQIATFLLLFIGFAIKLPMVPFHTWLPDAHVEAPTPISMILAGVLLKMGGYGIIRIAWPICPWAAKELAWYVALFGIISMVYGAFTAMAQTDFKKLVAYSSVSHMGYVLLGVAVWPTENNQFWSWGMNGAMFQMIGHGVTSAGMFFLVGVIYDRAHHRNLNNFRGLYEPMPLYAGISAVIFFAAMGLPGMCGFVGEFMVVLATWNFSKAFAILAALTVILTAGYVLWTVQRVFLGTNPAYKGYRDIDLRELSCAIPLVVFSILLGVLPGLLLSWMEPSVTGLVDTLYRLTASAK
ncbi:MAG: NADH-quinone oxidoreductase subunit M [Planctomycetes bacterium]|nr:NADH-quinone oxidoreductase subunit M [Planctomycetota bacterium]